MQNFFVTLVIASHLLQSDAGKDADSHPLSVKERETLANSLDAEINKTTAAIKQSPNDVRAYSRRGDALFFRGRFDEAVADYDKTIELDPRRADSHWQRGIALFYAGKYKQAADQFERYHTYDDVDRENGIWRYFSQLKAYGKDRAQQDLLKYKKDDREPFPSVYKLFQGQITPEQITTSIEAAKISDDEREKRQFYAHLYIGLNHALEDNPTAALVHLRKAVANPWPRTAGYGPHYMWHVARLHYDLLDQ